MPLVSEQLTSSIEEENTQSQRPIDHDQILTSALEHQATVDGDGMQLMAETGASVFERKVDGVDYTRKVDNQQPKDFLQRNTSIKF